MHKKRGPSLVFSVEKASTIMYFPKKNKTTLCKINHKLRKITVHFCTSYVVVVGPLIGSSIPPKKLTKLATSKLDPYLATCGNLGRLLISRKTRAQFIWPLN